MQTGFLDHNAIPAGAHTPLTYRKHNRLFRYASATPHPAVDWVAAGKVAAPRYQHGCSTLPFSRTSPTATPPLTLLCVRALQMGAGRFLPFRLWRRLWPSTTWRGLWSCRCSKCWTAWRLAETAAKGATRMTCSSTWQGWGPSLLPIDTPSPLPRWLQACATGPWYVPSSRLPPASCHVAHVGLLQEADAALHPRSTRISAWERVPPNDPLSLLKAVSSQPVVVALSTQLPAFYEYRGGILDDPAGECGSQPDHNLLIVGYGSAGGKDFWLAQNSWGRSWGEGGYIRIARYAQGAGVCGMLTIAPSYPVVDPFTRFSHSGSWQPVAEAPRNLRPLVTTAPPGHHPPGVGKRYPLGHHPIGEGHHPPGYGHHPAPNGHHQALQFVPQPGEAGAGVGLEWSGGRESESGDGVGVWCAATGCSGGMSGSPCGGGQCVVGAVLSEYTCRCPPGYVSAANSGDGKEVCAAEDVCLASSSNPCGVGDCRSDRQGAYTCSCPQGFRSAERSVDGTPTCAPGRSRTGHTAQLEAGGWRLKGYGGVAVVQRKLLLSISLPIPGWCQLAARAVSRWSRRRGWSTFSSCTSTRE